MSEKYFVAINIPYYEKFTVYEDRDSAYENYLSAIKEHQGNKYTRYVHILWGRIEDEMEISNEVCYD